MAKDYYKILGLTDEEKKLHGEEFVKAIKPKFKKLSVQHHPDKYSTAPEEVRKEHEEKFKEIAEAYDVLSDENKRAQYDMGGDNFHWNGFGFDPFEMFRRHFGNDFGGFGFGGFQQSNIIKGSDIRIRVNLTLKDVLEGGTKKVKFKRAKQCPSCKRKICPKCNGSGVSVNMQRFGNQVITTQTECPHCHGTGYINDGHCSECNDTGYVYSVVSEQIEIPKGVQSGMVLKLNGKGNEPIRYNDSDQYANGSLMVIFNVLEDERFERDGDNLITDLELNLLEAWNGCEVEVETLDGKTSIKIPKLTECGKLFRLKDKGLPNMSNPNYRGSLFIRIQYETPKTELNKKQVDLLKEFYKEKQ